MLPTPTVRRRMASFVYEGVLIFGLLMTAGLFYAGLTEQRNALAGRHGLQAFLFVVLGAYFGWFWSHGGQTVAMKTWRLRVQRVDGRPLTFTHALLRFLLSWLWFLPATMSLWLAGASSAAPIAAALTTGIVVYAALTRLHPDRQFWHDTVCGTRLVRWEPVGKGRA